MMSSKGKASKGKAGCEELPIINCSGRRELLEQVNLPARDHAQLRVVERRLLSREDKAAKQSLRAQASTSHARNSRTPSRTIKDG